MSIWTFRQVLRHGLIGGVLTFSLAACSGDTTPFALLGPGAQQAEDDGTRADVSLNKADMMRGAITLVPPSGYCVDKRGLKQNFAVIAQCNSLGRDSDTAVAPLGFILVAVSPVDGLADLPATMDALEGGSVERLEQQDRAGLSLRRLRGETPDGTNPEYWRGLSQAGRHVISTTAYAPEGGSLSGPAGAVALTDLAQRTQAASSSVLVASADEAQGAAPATERSKGLGRFISGLFD